MPMIEAEIKQRGVSRFVLLPAEVTFCTGLTDAMRADFRTMKAISDITKKEPSAWV